MGVTVAKFYAGIGSRDTPPNVLVAMTIIAQRLEKLGYILRSGAAEGADSAFEEGADSKEIYLPWKGFNNNPSGLYGVCRDALLMAEKFHPAWGRLSQGAQKLQARNCYQIQGGDLQTPSEFVVCWTPDGCEKSSDRTSRTGGTGQAIAIADSYGIPVFNLQRSDAVSRLKSFLGV